MTVAWEKWDVFTWALPTLLWVSGNVWSTSLPILTPFINSNYKAPQLVQMQQAKITGGEKLEREGKFFPCGSYVSTKKQTVSGILFSPSHACCLYLHFRFWSALVWMVVSWSNFLVPVSSPPIQPCCWPDKSMPQENYKLLCAPDPEKTPWGNDSDILRTLPVHSNKCQLPSGIKRPAIN